MRAFKFMSTVLNCEFALSGVLVYVHMLILYYGSLTSVAYRMIYVPEADYLGSINYIPHTLVVCTYTFLKYIACNSIITCIHSVYMWKEIISLLQTLVL